MSEKKIPVWLDFSINQLEVYRSPNLESARANLDPILRELHGISLQYREIEKLAIYDQNLTVGFTWVSRGCADSDEWKIPLSIINAPDPVHEAKLHRLKNRVSDLKTRCESLKRQAEFVEKDLQAAVKELDEILKQSVDKPS